MTNLANPKRQISVMRADTTPDTGRGWRSARKAVRWLATAALIAWLAMSVDWYAVWPAFEKASIPWLVFATVLYVGAQFSSFARWAHLVRAAGLTQSRARLLAAYFEGMFVNICLPSTVGGDLLKVLRVGGTQHKRLATSTVIADRASGLAVLLALLAGGLMLKFDRFGIFAALVSIAILVAGLPIAFWLLRHGAKSIDPVDRGQDSKPRRQLARFVPLGIRHLAIRTPWHWVIGWAFVVQVLNVAMFAAAAYSLGIHISPIEILVAATTVNVAASLPISIAGVGVREASLPLLLAADGVPRELAITLGIALSGIVLAVGLLGGPIHFLAQRAAARERESSAPATIVPARRSA